MKDFLLEIGTEELPANFANEAREPLKTLSTYRKINNRIIFGQNLIPDKPFGIVNVRDKITMI